MILTKHDKAQVYQNRKPEKVLTRAELARQAGMSPNVLYVRMKKGMTLEEALAMPVMTPSQVAANTHKNRRRRKK